MDDQEDKSESVEWSQDTFEIVDPDGYATDDERDYDDTPPSIERERTEKETKEIEDRNKSLELLKAEKEAREMIELEKVNLLRNTSNSQISKPLKPSYENSSFSQPVIGGRRKRKTKKSKKTKKTKKTKKSKKSRNSMRLMRLKKSKKSKKSKK